MSSAGRRPGHGVRTERRASHAGRAVGAGRGGPARPGRPTTRFAVEAGGDRRRDLPVVEALAAAGATPVAATERDLAPEVRRRRRDRRSAAVGFGGVPRRRTAGRRHVAGAVRQRARRRRTPPPSRRRPHRQERRPPRPPACPIASPHPGDRHASVRQLDRLHRLDEATSTFPTLERFTKETGIQINYEESIDDNETFFASNLTGPLEAGLPTPAGTSSS